MEESTRPSIVSLASSVVTELRHLAAQELQLAKQEMQQELRTLVKAATQAGVAVVLGPWPSYSCASRSCMSLTASVSHYGRAMAWWRCLRGPAPVRWPMR
jgi:hypothetical protein